MGALLNSWLDSMRHLWESVSSRPQAAALGSLVGAALSALWNALHTAFPLELPAILSITLLVLIDHRTGIRAAKHRGEQIISRVARTRLGNKLASYGEMYLVALAARTLSPTANFSVFGQDIPLGAGVLIYGGIMGVICSIEVWSILENKYETGEISVDPNTDGVLKTAKGILLGRKPEAPTNKN